MKTINLNLENLSHTDLDDVLRFFAKEDYDNPDHPLHPLWTALMEEAFDREPSVMYLTPGDVVVTELGNIGLVLWCDENYVYVKIHDCDDYIFLSKSTLLDNDYETIIVENLGPLTDEGMAKYRNVDGKISRA